GVAAREVPLPRLVCGAGRGGEGVVPVCFFPRGRAPVVPRRRRSATRHAALPRRRARQGVLPAARPRRCSTGGACGTPARGHGGAEPTRRRLADHAALPGADRGDLAGPAPLSRPLPRPPPP